VKQIFFLSGLARSGNTLLGSILNQNKNIAVTGNSVIFDVLKSVSDFKQHQTFLNFPDHDSFNNMISKIMPNYYEKWPQQYIIDRSQISEDRLLFLKRYYKQKIKIIVLWRDLFEILASFLKWSENRNIPMFGFNASNEEKIEMLMNKDTSNIFTGLNVIKNLSRLENMHLSHFVNYNDLIHNTEKELIKIYQFLEIPYFNHDLNNIEDFNVNGKTYKDEIYGKGLHSVRKGKIKKIKYDYKKYIPNSMYEKYKHLNYTPNLYG